MQNGVCGYLKYRAYKVSQKFWDSNFKNYHRDRKKYCDETSIPKELLMWQDPYDPVKSKPDVQGRNDVLVRIGQALLQGE